MNRAKSQAAARRMAQALGVPPSHKAEQVLTRMLEALVREALAEAAATAPPPPRPPVRWEPPEGRPPGSYYPIPFMAKSAHGRPLQRVVARVADEMGTSDYFAATALTFAFEQIAFEMDHGELVRVPGFGVFGPCLWTARDGREVVVPRFVAGRPLRNEVAAHCHPLHTRNRDLENYRRSHHPSSRPDKRDSRTFKVMQAMRDHVERHAGGPVSHK